MSDKPTTLKFDSDEHAQQYLREKCDDIESVDIPLPEEICFAGPAGKVSSKGVGAMLKMVGGGTLVVSREDAESLINSGILSRLNIPCRLVVIDR